MLYRSMGSGEADAKYLRAKLSLRGHVLLSNEASGLRVEGRLGFRAV